jgi:hypothetical protein
MRRRLGLSLALAAGLLAGAGAARADILVTRDGAKLTTRGPWKVEGRRVVFTSENGTLSALRTEEVDLDQSALSTARAQQEAKETVAPAAKAPTGEPVLRLTEKDIPPIGEEGESEGSAEGGEKSPASSVPLEVASWDRLPLPDGDGIEVFGTLRNNGNSNIIAPSVTVAVYGEQGGLLATSDGSVNQSSIAPGKGANFRAPFPGLSDFTAIKFQFGGRGYETNPAGAAREEDQAVDNAAEAAETATNEPPPEPEAPPPGS